MRARPVHKDKRKALKSGKGGAPIDLKVVFEDIERIRKRAKLPKGVTIKSLIETGRV